MSWFRRWFDPSYCDKSPDHVHRYSEGEDYPEHCVYCGQSVYFEEGKKTP